MSEHEDSLQAAINEVAALRKADENQHRCDAFVNNPELQLEDRTIGMLDDLPRCAQVYIKSLREALWQSQNRED